MLSNFFSQMSRWVFAVTPSAVIGRMLRIVTALAAALVLVWSSGAHAAAVIYGTITENTLNSLPGFGLGNRISIELTKIPKLGNTYPGYTITFNNLSQSSIGIPFELRGGIGELSSLGVGANNFSLSQVSPNAEAWGGLPGALDTRISIDITGAAVAGSLAIPIPDGVYTFWQATSLPDIGGFVTGSGYIGYYGDYGTTFSRVLGFEITQINEVPVPNTVWLIVCGVMANLFGVYGRRPRLISARTSSR
jgi:hypothetical protein